MTLLGGGDGTVCCLLLKLSLPPKRSAPCQHPHAPTSRMMVVGGGEGTVMPSARCRSARKRPRRWRRPAASMVRPGGRCIAMPLCGHSNISTTNYRYYEWANGMVPATESQH